MIISAVSGAEVIGLTSATVALAGIVTSILTFGEGVGIQRFVGMFRG